MEMQLSQTFDTSQYLTQLHLHTSQYLTGGGSGGGGGGGSGGNGGATTGEPLVDTTHERTAAFVAFLSFTVAMSMAYANTGRKRLRIRSKSVRTKRALKATANDIMRWAARPKDIDIMDSYIGADEEDQDGEDALMGGRRRARGRRDSGGGDGGGDGGGGSRSSRRDSGNSKKDRVRKLGMLLIPWRWRTHVMAAIPNFEETGMWVLSTLLMMFVAVGLTREQLQSPLLE